MTTISLLKSNAIQGIFFQEAVGQGIDGTQEVVNAITGAPVKKDLALIMPLVAADKVDTPEAKAVIARVFPPAN
ncbi:hypothetical protein EV129_101818 [Rhizobium azibense]|uniref:Substrate-binding family protein n=1 Tax=Rhizobium azibense TaxID=1136135 RepID=A0A4R3S2V2_9HYPH|nr:hypothetical protein EV129_101818 [Rhizobium azibense]